MIMSLTNEIKIVHPDPNRILHDKNPEEFLELIFRILNQKHSDSWGDLEIGQMATQLASYSGINLYKTMNKNGLNNNFFLFKSSTQKKHQTITKTNPKSKWRTHSS